MRKTMVKTSLIVVAAAATVLTPRVLSAGREAQVDADARPRLPISLELLDARPAALPLLPALVPVRLANLSASNIVITDPEVWRWGLRCAARVDRPTLDSHMRGQGMMWYAVYQAGPLPGSPTITIEAGSSVTLPVRLLSGYAPSMRGRPRVENVLEADAWPEGEYRLQIELTCALDRNFTIGGQRPDRRAAAVSDPFTLTVTEPTDPRTRDAYHLFRDRGMSPDTLGQANILDPKALALALHAQRTGLDRYLWNRVAGHQRQRINWELSLLEQGLLINTFSVKEQEPFTSSEHLQYFRDWLDYLVPGPALDEVLPADELGLSPDDLALLAQLRDQPVARRNRLLLGLAYPQALTQSPDLVWLRYPDTPYGAALSGK